MTQLLLALALAQTPGQAAPPDLAAVIAASERVWLCPLHPETHAGGPGRCEVCRRPFEERAVTWRWSCPMHPELSAAEEGPCPVCEMDRVVTTVEVVWRCPDDPRDVRNAPGACRGGSTALRPELRALAHGDHNPRHGGLFFMAADRFHHLEGALREGRFRLYLYDDYTEPLPPSAAVARIGEARLRASPDGRALELPLEAELPAEVVLHVDFGEGEQRYDFVFSAESLPPSLPELVIPDSVPALLGEIERRDARLRELMRLGAWTELYLPALQAKELALALAGREPATDRLALKRLVRGAWLLDLYGDVADREGVERAYALFREGWRGLSGAR
jgi:hypothetical protein